MITSSDDEYDDDEYRTVMSTNPSTMGRYTERKEIRLLSLLLLTCYRYRYPHTHITRTLQIKYQELEDTYHNTIPSPLLLLLLLFVAIFLLTDWMDG